MNIYEDEHGFRYFTSLEDCKPEYTPMKAWSVLNFYTIGCKTPKDVATDIREKSKAIEEKWTRPIYSKESARIRMRQSMGLYDSDESSDLSIRNVYPIPDLKYLIHNRAVDRYYEREFRCYPAEVLFFMKRTDEYLGNNIEIESLRRYVYDDNVYLLLSPDDIASTTDMLKRLWKSMLKGEGKVPYKDFIDLLQESLMLEDYKEYSSGLVGYKTVCKQFSDRIAAIWKKISETKKG